MTRDADKPALITTAEAADLLGVAVSTVNRMAARGELTPVVKGAGIRGARHYDRADVEKLRAEGQVPSMSEVKVTRFRERFTTCASCRAEARWMVNGTTTCDRHRATWIRRAEKKQVPA